MSDIELLYNAKKYLENNIEKLGIKLKILIYSKRIDSDYILPFMRIEICEIINEYGMRFEALMRSTFNSKIFVSYDYNYEHMNMQLNKTMFYEIYPSEIIYLLRVIDYIIEMKEIR
jgi:hypothetical protein